MHQIMSQRLRLAEPYLYREINAIIPDLSTTDTDKIVVSYEQLRQLFSIGLSIHFLLTGKFEEFNYTESGRLLQEILNADREINIKAKLTNILYHNSICYLCDYDFFLEQASMRR